MQIRVSMIERLSQTELMYLNIVADAGRSLTSTEIATKAGKWRASVCPALHKLAALGYLQRRRRKERTRTFSGHVILWGMTVKATESLSALSDYQNLKDYV
jgi:DNA-binding IclR family transcriptional regulator